MKLIQLLRTRRQNSFKSRVGWVAFTASLLLAGASLVYADGHEASAESESSSVKTNATLLRIGYRLDAMPFSYQDESGQPAGYTVEICKRIVEKMQTTMGRVTVEYIGLTLAQRGPALLDGKVDLLCGADSVTLERRKAVSFSIPIFVGGIGALLRTDAASRLRALMEGQEPEFRPRWRASFAQILKQRTFAVIDSSLAQNWLADAISEFDIIADTAVVKDYADGVSQIANRDADVFFGDRAILLDAAQRGPDAGKLYVVGRRFTDEPIALAMAKGNEDLRLFVDTVLSELYRSDDIVEIYSEFFGAPDADTLTMFRISALPE